MNKRLIYFLLLIFSSFIFSSGRITYKSKPDAISGPTMKPVRSWVYIDLIITDFETGIPEGHYLYNLPKQSGITTKDIDVKVSQQNAGDFGNTAITYGANNDTLFAGSVVWMGTGSRTIPVLLDTNLTEDKQLLTKPAYIQYLNTDTVSVDHEYKQKAELAWIHVSKMQVLYSCQGINFKTAFFLYTPSTGKTNFSKAKWVILLERDAGNW